MQIWARTDMQIRCVMCRSRKIKSRPDVEVERSKVDQIPCTLDRGAISALITVLSTVFRKEKWRIVGAFSLFACSLF